MDATIVIPTYNRQEALLQSLSALARLDYPSDRWEVIVVDDGSTDGTGEALEEWIRTCGTAARCIRLTRGGPARARNCGAIEARGETLVFIDNDILVEPDFLQRHLQASTEHPGCWVVGRIVHPPQLLATPFGRYRAGLWESYHRSHPQTEISETAGISAANLSLPARDFGRLGGFDESITIASSEDWELGLRARQAGIRVLYDPGIVVLHNDWAVSLDRFCERQRLYSISDVLLWHKYGELSPRARLVRESSPVNWRQDSLRLIVKKQLKHLLASERGRHLLRAGCWLSERWAPDSRWNQRAYDLAIAVAIYCGVREGLERYGADPSTAGPSMQLEKV
jgi:GT2 family glycosyltransferase